MSNDLYKRRKRLFNTSDMEEGEIIYDPVASVMYKRKGNRWQAWIDEYEELDDLHRIQFESEEKELWKEHPDLEKVWKEYKILRRLKTGK
jgi:hypothetical protein